MQEKKELRKKAREIRKSLNIEEISKKIVNNILKSETYQKAQHVMIFYPLEHEVNLLPLLAESRGKIFYLPKVQGENLLVCPFKIGDELTLSKFKTQEPVTESVNAQILDIIFVPALMADKDLHRLGYGGGFYDKFFARNALKALKIVAIPNSLITAKLPKEPFDAKIDFLICEDIVKKT